ncbi:hypothetical protein [Nocardioides sp. TF02-7]|uniref:hypothetical protein n=1 Tax=Nocardioides sp. TF02-7 TaxID=2917724 RepID=UPI001F06CA16|nr:hypothetical protein [Nocardioides sp. TF02-7]UMG91957.1 hypothetical protein MF408_18365 [Nocardioides sp. TF02-7]
MRSIDIAGVMPDPPVMKSRWLLVGVAGLSVSVKSPCAWLRCRTSPGRASWTRCRETCPSWCARTVRVIRSPRPRRRRRDRERARQATGGAGEVDPDEDVLAGAVAAPGRGGLEGQGGDRGGADPGGLPPDVDDARPHLVRRPHRVDVLEVAVDAVRAGERGDDAGPEDAAGDVREDGAHRYSRNSVNIRTPKLSRLPPPPVKQIAA